MSGKEHRSSLGLRCLPAVLLCCHTVATSVQATTWFVEHDPGNPEGLVGAAVAQAASGDTILIGPGLYYEHIPIAQMELTLIGRDGAEATILDGSRPAAPLEGSILRWVPGTYRSLKIRDLTLQRGQGRLATYGYAEGGAIYWAGDFRAERCVFRENQLLSGWYSTGGAISAGGGSTTIEECRFLENAATAAGSDLDQSGGSGLVVRRSVFESSLPTAGSLEFSGEPGVLALIEDCRFRRSGGGPYSGNPATFWDVDVTLRRNRCESLPPHGGATTLSFRHISYDDFYPSEVALEENEFWEGCPGAVSVIGLHRVRVGLRVRGNTFHRVRIESESLRELELERNIFSEAPVLLGSAGPIRLVCNDAWPESFQVGPPSHIVEEYGNLLVDPLLCDPANGDLSLRAESPCAPENSPAGCGRIGARPVGCDATPVERTTWSRLKWWSLAKGNWGRR